MRDPTNRTGPVRLADELKRLAVGAGPSGGRRIYATFDGALFEDIEASLIAAGLAHRSLYKGVSDADLVDAGPWLVNLQAAHIEYGTSPDGVLEDAPDLSSEALRARADAMAADYAASLEEVLPIPIDPTATLARIEAATALLSDVPHAAVFWIGGADLDERTIWRHARSLNRVSVPREFADGRHATNDSERIDVLFRHADGNVLGEVLLLLDETQFARLIGPASGIVFLSPDHPSASGNTLKRVPRPTDRETPGGLLALTREQMHALDRRRDGPLLEAIRDHLNGGGASRCTVEDVAGLCERARGVHGFEADRHLRDYCEIVWRNGVAIENHPTFHAVMARAAWSREEKCRRLCEAFLPRLPEGTERLEAIDA